MSEGGSKKKGKGREGVSTGARGEGGGRVELKLERCCQQKFGSMASGAQVEMFYPKTQHGVCLFITFGASLECGVAHVEHRRVLKYSCLLQFAPTANHVSPLDCAQ